MITDGLSTCRGTDNCVCREYLLNRRKSVSLDKIFETLPSFLNFSFCFLSITEVPGGPLTNFNDGGGSDRGSYFIPEKITTSEFVYPQKITTFLAYPKKSLSPLFATRLFFSRFKNIPASFIDPKKSLWTKISDPKKSLAPFPPPSPRH